MCYYHQNACLLVCLSLLSACLSVKLQGMIQVTREIQGKWVGAQNQKHPNREKNKIFKITK